MARKKATRKFQLTFNNPQTHGYTHERIRFILEQFPGLEYWCMCDETGEQGTPHTHLYMASRNAIQYETIHRRFYGVHVEAANGSHRENRDYIRKEGKWLDDAKHETNHPETFEEWGELPPDKSNGESQSEKIVQLIRDGKTNAEILAEVPTAYNRLNHIEQARQTLLEDQFKDKWRELHTVYIWGETGAGKTRSIMEEHGYSKVYRVTDYAHPFDNYKGQDVILFEEFRSSLPLASMLNYLDGYPVELPCRYANKVACYTKVYLVSNIPLHEQYPNVQQNEPESWKAFERRIHEVQYMTKGFEELPPDETLDIDAIFGESGV